MLIVYVLGAMAIVFAVFWLKFVYQRVRCARKIKTLCESRSWYMHTSGAFWYLGKMSREDWDGCIEKNEETIALKLVGTPWRKSVLVIKENGDWYFQRLLSLQLQVRFAFRSKIYHIPEEKKKKLHPMLVVHPATLAVVRNKPDGAVCGYGELAGGMRVMSLEDLMVL